MKVLILANKDSGLYQFRKELMEEIVKKYDLYVSVPDGEFIPDIRKLGCRVSVNKVIDRRGTNPAEEIKLIRYYWKLVKRLRPDVALTYTIKPNIYGGAVCAGLGIPCIASITGLGTSVQNRGALEFITLSLYRFGLRKAYSVFFQNQENREYMIRHYIVKPEKTRITPGSGVNTDQHCYESYPGNDGMVIFTTVGRIMKDKGVDELFAAAERIKKNHPGTLFRLIGSFEGDYEEKVSKLQKRGIVEFLGSRKDIHPFIASSHAVIHASYHEGMSNVLQEAASTGRPVIATDVHGCIETFEPGVTGIAFKAKNAGSLVDAIEKFLSLSHEQKEEMGRKGREKMVREFDRRIVVDKYMAEIERAMESARI